MVLGDEIHWICWLIKEWEKSRANRRFMDNDPAYRERKFRAGNIWEAKKILSSDLDILN